MIDTSVLVAAARSRLGASFELIASIPSNRFEICLSIGLYLEWQDAICRPENVPSESSPNEALGFLRYLAGNSHLQEIHFLWRPFLNDPNDDMVLELAIAAGCREIVTHNVKDFLLAAPIGISAVTPGQFLKDLRS